MTKSDSARKPAVPKWELKLYVAGQTAKSLTAFSNLKHICEVHLDGEYHIEVIDLLKNPRQPGLKVLFMSGYADNVIEHHGVLEAVGQFIQKPFRPEELAQKIRTLLGQAAPALASDD